MGRLPVRLRRPPGASPGPSGGGRCRIGTDLGPAELPTTEPLRAWPSWSDWNLASSFVAEDKVARLHEEGLSVSTWTVDEPDDVDRMVSAGVDAIGEQPHLPAPAAPRRRRPARPLGLAPPGPPCPSAGRTARLPGSQVGPTALPARPCTIAPWHRRREHASVTETGSSTSPQPSSGSASGSSSASRWPPSRPGRSPPPEAVAMAIGRVAGLTGAYLMLRHGPADRAAPLARARRRPGPPRPLAPPDRARGRLCSSPPTSCSSRSATPSWPRSARCTSSGSSSPPTPTCSPPSSASACSSWPGSPRSAIARRHLKYETWWIVHLYIVPRPGPRLRPSDRDGRLVRRPPADPGDLDRGLGRHRRDSSSSSGSCCRSCATSATGSRRRASARRHPGSSRSSARDDELDRLAVSGGQFFQWRFLTRELWWHAHPYSLSALPRPPYIRVTVKALGDQSRAVAHLKPGTRVCDRRTLRGLHPSRPLVGPGRADRRRGRHHPAAGAPRGPSRRRSTSP